MRGFCIKCREYRSDEGMDAWKIEWQEGLGLCERCGSVVDVWEEGEEESFDPEEDEL